MLHFIIPTQFSEQLAALPDQTVGGNYPYWLGGRFNWVAQSYMILRQYREGMTISSAPKPGVRNFSHCMGWRATGDRVGEYRISVRADYPRLRDIDFELLQNSVAPRGAKQAYVPYWPVPGIIPRDPARQGVSRIAYAGRLGANNLAGPLKSLGIQPGGRELAVIAPDQWHDMSQVDLLIAIRDFSGATHDNKPPSKLFNSWIAGIPLIGGTDSAFSSVGRPGIDYVRVTNESEFTKALERMCNDSGFYEGIAQAGKGRRAEVTIESIAADWLKVLDGPILSDFQAWCANQGHKRRPVLPPLLDRSRDALSTFKQKLSPRRL